MCDLRTQKWIDRVLAKYPQNADLFDYSQVVVVGCKEKVNIICKQCGKVFPQTPDAHLNLGRGCPDCRKAQAKKNSGASRKGKANLNRRSSTEEWIAKVLAKHPEFADKYDYSQAVYTKTDEPVTIICKTCGRVCTPKARKHMAGQGCKSCAGRKTPNLGREEFIRRANAKHGEGTYDYSKVEYVNEKTPVCIICPKHGEFMQAPENHLNGQGCKKCYQEGKFLSREEVLKRCNDVHGDFYDYSLVEYKGYSEKVDIICPKHGVFSQSMADHLYGKGCPKCVHHISSQEMECFEFVKAICGDAEQSNRNMLDGLELDIYVPSHKVAIEINGIWWHCDQRRGIKYHHNKWLACKEKGIRLIQITDWEWENKKDNFKTLIKQALGASDVRKFNARDCDVVHLEAKECKEFFEKNHIQGHASNPVNLALKTGDEIVAIMSFGYGNTSRGSSSTNASWELSRFATVGNVRGGASKLFKHFVEEYHPEEVRSFSMNNFFTGGMYKALGFVAEDVEPDYMVFHPFSGLRHKAYWQRRNIPKRLKELGKEGLNFDPETDQRTEKEMEDLVGALRIWDSGKVRWTWKPENN